MTIDRGAPNSERSFELLEGMTTNCFVVFKDGSIGTSCSDDVLQGYSRSLFLQSAKQAGIPIKPNVNLSDADDWEEVFVTSSVKIGKRVGEVLVKNEAFGPANPGEPEFMVKWKESNTRRKAGPPSVFERLLADVTNKLKG